MNTETEQTETRQTDVKTLVTQLRREVKEITLSDDGDEMPWGDVDALEQLAERYWRPQSEILLMIVADWLAHAERYPATVERVFGAGPGAGMRQEGVEP